MQLHEFFGVSDRTTRRWAADGADLTDAAGLIRYLRNLMRPAQSVERRLADPDCFCDLDELLNGDEYADYEKEPVDFAAVRFRDDDERVMSAAEFAKAGKELGEYFELFMQVLREDAPKDVEWNEVVIRVSLASTTKAHPMGARMVPCEA